jgi:hypothetical protein
LNFFPGYTSPSLRGAGGGGGGGGAEGSGVGGNPGNPGSAANPTAINSVGVTPGGSYPISIASGGTIVITWNPQ